MRKVGPCFEVEAEADGDEHSTFYYIPVALLKQVTPSGRDEEDYVGVALEQHTGRTDIAICSYDLDTRYDAEGDAWEEQFGEERNH